MEQNVTFNKLLFFIQRFANRSKFINSYGFGNLVEFGKDVDNTTPLYPLLFVVPNSIEYNENTTTYGLSIFMADKLNDDLEGAESIISSMSMVMRDFISAFKLSDVYMNVADFSFPVIGQPFLERFNDVLAGVSVDFNFIVSDYMEICEIVDELNYSYDKLTVLRFDEVSVGSFLGDYVLSGTGYWTGSQIINGALSGVSYPIYIKEGDQSLPNQYLIWSSNQNRFQFVEIRVGGTATYGYNIPSTTVNGGSIIAQEGIWADNIGIDKVEFYYLIS